jgi:SAM-dependent methyltransferase
MTRLSRVEERRLVNETEEVRRRYEKRRHTVVTGRYSALNPEVWLWMQERQRALIALLERYAPAPLDQLRVLEIGCGAGSNLLELIGLGFDPEKLVANELLSERCSLARRNLPAACQVAPGDALKLPFPEGSFDIVYQSTVFSSLLDDAFQQQLARKMWNWVRPGGAVLWYDFTFDNPQNRDVRGVTLARVRELFPDAVLLKRRVTLAPPIARRVSRVHPIAYHLFNAVPLLRTHVLCWIKK